MCLLFSVTVASAQRLHQKGSLRGMPGVFVEVQKINPEVEIYGLTAPQIKTDTELRLRKAGIRVSNASGDSGVGMPQLYISLNTMRVDDDTYVFNFNVEVNDFATLERKNTGAGSNIVTIWGKGGMGVIGASNLRNVRENINDLVDQFINEYLSVNGK